MSALPPSRTSLRVVSGEVQGKTYTSRMIFPSSTQASWPLFERLGEVIATSSRPFPAHGHQNQEVLTYIVEGFANYQMDDGTAEPLPAGAARLLTSPVKSTHRVSPARGGPIRWFNIVVTLPPGAAATNRLQTISPIPTTGAEGATYRTLVGPHGGLASAAGLESKAIDFVEEGTTFQRVGHDRRGVVYALGGRGEIDGQAIEVGEAVLVEDASGIAIHGFEGLKLLLNTVPRPK